VIVPYDPDVHRRFVFSAWCGGAGEPFERLHRILRDGARCAVRVGNKNQPVLIGGQNRILIMGCAIIAAPQTVVWAYTKARLVHQGIMKALLEHLGVDRSRPITALFWSPLAQESVDQMNARGWQITFGVDGAVRGDERRDTA